MKLYEHQARELFSRYGIPVLPGETAGSPEQAAKAAAALGGKVAVKAQVLTGGRGKAGGIKIADSPGSAGEAAGEILAMRIKSFQVPRVLIVPAVDIRQEFYLAVTLDRAERRLILIASASGGVDIEELASKSPEKIATIPLGTGAGLDTGGCGKALRAQFGEQSDAVCSIGRDMLRMYVEQDCTLVEINPLGLLGDGRLVALDAKVTIDDNALYKHPELEHMRNPEEYESGELEARSAGLSFIQLEGNIGCVVNGAGLAMATMDLIKQFGGEPANFLDVGGSSSPEKTVHALTIISRNPGVRAILINIFGGITRCDDIARGLLQARDQVDLDIPLVIRLIGTNEEEGRRILKEVGIDAHDKLTDAVRQVVSYVEETR